MPGTKWSPWPCRRCAFAAAVSGARRFGGYNDESKTREGWGGAEAHRGGARRPGGGLGAADRRRLAAELRRQQIGEELAPVAAGAPELERVHGEQEEAMAELYVQSAGRERQRGLAIDDGQRRAHGERKGIDEGGAQGGNGRGLGLAGTTGSTGGVLTATGDRAMVDTATDAGQMHSGSDSCPRRTTGRWWAGPSTVLLESSCTVAASPFSFSFSISFLYFFFFPQLAKYSGNKWIL